MLPQVCQLPYSLLADTTEGVAYALWLRAPERRGTVGAHGKTLHMEEMRGEERWVGACLVAALPTITIKQHDDGSRPSMYDLDLVRDEVVVGACEVTAAADAESIELWILMNGSDERWIEDGLAGGWMVTVTPKARAKRLKKELPGLLKAIGTSSDDQAHKKTTEQFNALGILSASQGATSFQGSIYVTLERGLEHMGGFVASTGDGLVDWLDDWVREETQDHNLDKLRASGLGEQHLFVLFPGFASAPFSASDLLMRDDVPLPTRAPALPSGLTDVWLMSTWTSGDVFHFDGDGWTMSTKVFEV